MPNEIILKIYDAEEAANQAEIKARQRADEIIKTAKTDAENKAELAIKSALTEKEQYLKKIKKQAQTLISSTPETINPKTKKLEENAMQWREEAIKEIIETLI